MVAQKVFIYSRTVRFTLVHLRPGSAREQTSTFWGETYLGCCTRAATVQAQAQIAKATAVADEALGNIRVVRAFGMEDQEKGMYSSEIDEAKYFNERLGHGIGIFQVCFMFKRRQCINVIGDPHISRAW